MKEKQKILIIEDEVVNRRILKKILEEDYELLEADNGAAGWDILRGENSGDVDAVLLDLVMPVMDGFEVLDRMRKASMAEMPVIVMTGETDQKAEQNALEAGAWDFVTKPYNPRVLKSRLRNAIARRQVSVYEKMQKMAAHDPLTGLHNRARMFAKTRQMIDEHPGEKFLFLKVDIDRFALYNAAFGEEEGDKLLCFLAGLFRNMAQKYELITFGRMNADVFCACVRHNGNTEILERAVEEVQKKLASYRSNYLLEISVGVYLIDEPSLSVEEFYLRASMAGQKCKSQYGKHISYYDEDYRRHAAEELLIANEMKHALEDNQFVVYLQPKVNLTSDKACGAEALVRWLHPEKGLVSPGIFIPVFERNGFIAQLDYYVWEQTCKMLKKWTEGGYQVYPVSVNISRISLYNPGLKNLLVGLVEKYGIDYALLQLEITESAYMTSPELMQETIHSLRIAGFTILMDDFGSGYSSLNTLKDIEVDILKLDMQFLPKDDKVEKGEIILASMIKMANWLGMQVIVEGVETRKQRDFLEGAGCECVQGYYYSKPIPQEEYEADYIQKTDKDQTEIKGDYIQDSPAHNVTILVIDDVESDRVILQEFFKEMYHVKLCENTEEALVYLKNHKRQVHLILLDNVMPGMSGLDFLTYCQDEPSLSSIPKIMITASSHPEDQIKAFKQGAYDYITKPLVKEIVMARVQHVMEISKQYRIFENWEYDYRDLAKRDLATGLLNKTAFQEMGMRMMTSYPDTVKALLIIDIDDFKNVNDKYGHLVGDEVIKCVADVLAKEFRKSDLVGRFGGDEFMVLLPGMSDPETARKKAEDIIKTVAITAARDHHVNTSLSIGIAFSEEKDTFDSLFGRTDEAVYEAKKTGKSKAVIFGEKVPPVLDDDKPLVLICGEDPQLYPTLALSYGESAAFANINSFQGLRDMFDKYVKRICAVCLDMQKTVMPDSDEFYQYIVNHGGGTHIPILAVCKEGDMQHLKAALELNIQDVLTLPPHMDTIQRRLSRAIISKN